MRISGRSLDDAKEARALRLENAELRAQLKKAADESVCAWCGDVGPKNAEYIFGHQVSCEARKCALETELRALRPQLAQARAALDLIRMEHPDCPSCQAALREAEVKP